jgi:hypothetical protein
LAERVVVEGWALKTAAEAAGVSVRCARNSVGGYRLEGERGLLDRSSRPKRVANQTPKERIRLIVAMRRLRFTGPEIAELLGMAVSTVSGILTHPPLPAANKRQGRALHPHPAWRLGLRGDLPLKQRTRLASRRRDDQSKLAATGSMLPKPALGAYP